MMTFLSFFSRKERKRTQVHSTDQTDLSRNGKQGTYISKRPHLLAFLLIERDRPSASLWNRLLVLVYPVERLLLQAPLLQ